MMFSKLSTIFVAITLAAFATAAGVPQNGGVPQNEGVPNNKGVEGQPKTGNSSCSGPVKCCKDTRPATAADISLAREKLPAADIAVNRNVWVECTDLSVLISQGKTCTGHIVCCDKSATDGSIAIDCTNTTA